MCNCITDVAVTGDNSFTKSAVNYQSDFPTDSLIAYFPFNGNAKDHSNYGNVSTLNGDYSFTTDRNGNPGRALSLNSNNPNGQGFASIPNNSFVAPLTNQITISAWVNVTKWYNGFGLIVNKYLQNQSNLQLYITPKSIASDGGHSSAVTPVTLNLNEWHHIAFVVNGTQRIYYLDGKRIGTGTYSELQSNNGSLDIGKDPYGNLEYMIGSIDEVRIYSKALNDSEIKELAQ